jgi:hypothetical protein
VSEILSGKLGMGKAQARQLAELLRVPVDLFLWPASSAPAQHTRVRQPRGAAVQQAKARWVPGTALQRRVGGLHRAGSDSAFFLVDS